MEDQITPAPWKWVFLGTAGNYFLLGNDGEGPITHSTPDSADGRLKQAAPNLLAACEAALRHIGEIPLAEIDWRNADEIIDQLETAIAAVKGEAGQC